MNPELRRNLWIELTLHRMVAMPAVFLMVVAIFVARDPRDWRGAVTMTAIGVFVLMVHLLGTRSAAESVTGEVRDRTWDWQRLSSLGPWRMTWGKLAGASAFAWYAGAVCLVAFAVASLGMRTVAAGWTILLMVASAVTLHGAALAGSLQASRKASRVGHRMGILLLVPLALGISGLLFGDHKEASAQTVWFGHAFGALPFAAVSSVAFAAWAVLGAYREMCRELSVRTLPVAFPAFAVFLGVYAAGFVGPTATPAEAIILMGLIACVGATYYALFADLTTAISLRRLALHAGARQWRRAAEEIPAWVTSLACACVFALAAGVLLDRRAAVEGAAWIGLYPVAIVLLALRDCGLLVFFALGPRPRRVDGATLLYIFLFGFLIPGVLQVFSDALAAAFMPLGRVGGMQAALVLAVHVALVWGAAAWRWRRLQRAYDAA